MAFGKAEIVAATDGGARACASAARISTTGGGAAALFHSSVGGGAKDAVLVKKVLSSGHRSIFEHQTYFVAFEDVSVAVEQALIEFRLGSFTVKSRRYVDFSGAGYVVPEDLSAEQEIVYRARMDGLFALYGKLIEAGVPREDARFVLPYCFRSNFYMTMNARELTHLVCTLLWGRLSADPELKALGESLAERLEKDWPGCLETARAGYAPGVPFSADRRSKPAPGYSARPSVELLRGEPEAETRLSEALAFSGRSDRSVPDLVRDERPRELEFLSYDFLVRDASLACVTHFTRHRMQSILVPDVREALSLGGYIVPESVSSLDGLLPEYVGAFSGAREDCARLLASGMRPEYAKYFCLAGMTIPLKIRMNARELLLFLRLRTCERAQWEIRALARDMLALLRRSAPGVFSAFGPGCKIYGKCPEGRLSCGNPPKL